MILYSILFLKCPRCRKGKFLVSHPYDLASYNRVRENCPVCDLKYRLEPSFYYGSMYVSYGVGVAIAIAVFLLNWLLGMVENLFGIFLLIMGALVLTMPYVGAVSKAIWAHMFFKYDPESVSLSRKRNSPNPPKTS